jgi:uncharacterized protein
MPTTFLVDGPEQAKHAILLAHGAGAPMDSPATTAAAKALAQSGFRVARFEFGYMASRQTSAPESPRPVRIRWDRSTWVIDALGATKPLIIGGKSMGGRVASMIADELQASCRVAGLLCLGYPFHPIGKPDRLRTRHLAEMKTSTLIVEGTRDLFGARDEMATYALSRNIKILWLEDGDHDLKPRKSVSGFSAADHLRTLAETASAWATRIAGW